MPGARTLRAGDSDEVAALLRGYRPLPPGHPTITQSRELASGVGREMGTVWRSRPRSILVKLGISLGLGLAYLAFIRLFQCDQKGELLPYLALYALSGVIGGVVCTNSLSWDANRVREALTSGRRLWQILLSKNVTMFVLVGLVGLVLSLVLAWRAEYGATLAKALGQLVTMMLLWLGVWAKQSMIQELGGVTVPILMLVASGLVLYSLLTALAVSLSDQPRFRRALLREMVDYRVAAAGTG